MIILMMNLLAKPANALAFILISLFLFAGVVSAQELPEATGSGDGKTRSCEARKAAVQRQVNKIINRVDMISSRLDQKVQKAIDFNNKKLATHSASIANLDQIKDTIASKSAAISEATVSAALKAQNFDCSNPQQSMQEFKTEMKNVIKALNEQKRAVMELFKSAHSKAKSANLTRGRGGQKDLMMPGEQRGKRGASESAEMEEQRQLKRGGPPQDRGQGRGGNR
jgi:hypothetical protein